MMAWERTFRRKSVGWMGSNACVNRWNWICQDRSLLFRKQIYSDFQEGSPALSAESKQLMINNFLFIDHCILPWVQHWSWTRNSISITCLSQTLFEFSVQPSSWILDNSYIDCYDFISWNQENACYMQHLSNFI